MYESAASARFDIQRIGCRIERTPKPCGALKHQFPWAASIGHALQPGIMCQLALMPLKADSYALSLLRAIPDRRPGCIFCITDRVHPILRSQCSPLLEHYGLGQRQVDHTDLCNNCEGSHSTTWVLRHPQFCWQPLDVVLVVAVGFDSWTGS